MKEQKLLPGILPTVETETDEDGHTAFDGIAVGQRRKDGGFKPVQWKTAAENDLFKHVDERTVDVPALLKPVADAFGAKAKANLKTGKLAVYAPVVVHCGGSMVRLCTEVVAATLASADRLKAYVRVVGELGMYVKVDLSMNMVKLWLVDLNEVDSAALDRVELAGEKRQFAKRIDNVRWVEVEI